MSRPLKLLMAAMVLVFYVDAFLVGASLWMALLFSLIGVLVLTGFLHHAEHDMAESVQLITPVLAAVGSLTVLALHHSMICPVVLSAAVVGSAGGLAERLSRNRWPGIGAALYCGAFTGMTSEMVLVHPGWVLLAGALSGVLLDLLRNSWAGIGGKLGSTAFLAVFGSCGLALAFGGIGTGVELHTFSQTERLAMPVVVVLGAQITQLLSYDLRLGAVLGSALPCLLAGWLLPGPLAAAWMGASFVGMTSPARLEPRPRLQLLAMGLLFGVFTLGFQPSLAGIGGDLGATAAMAVFTVLGLRRLLQFRRRSPAPADPTQP